MLCSYGNDLKDGIFDEVHYSARDEARLDMREFVEVLCGHKICFFKKGRYASVYHNRHSGTVLKIGDAQNNAGYLAYLRLARANQDNPFFPIVHYVSLFLTEEESYFVVKLEKLYEGRAYLKKRLHMPGWWRVSQFIQSCVLKQGYVLDNFMGQQTPKSLMDYMVLLKTTFRANDFKWDIHEGNMMMRENGQLVITDPWA